MKPYNIIYTISCGETKRTVRDLFLTHETNFRKIANDYRKRLVGLIPDWKKVCNIQVSKAY